MSMIGHLVRLPERIAREWTGASDDEIFELLDEDVHPSLNLDKSWHVLHFLLTGEISDAAGPLGFLLVGGSPLGEDLGYGPGRLFSPAEVAAIDDALTPLTEVDLRASYRAETMPELYAWSADDDEEMSYFLGHFTPLKAFVNKSRGNSLLVYLD